MTAGETTAGPVILGGCPRSGLALLRTVLDSHPEIACGPDAGFEAFARLERDLDAASGAVYAEVLGLDRAMRRAIFGRAVLSLAQGRSRAAGKRIAGMKSPMNVLFFSDFAAMMPDALFVHVVRDGRDVAASLLERRWTDPRTGRVFDHCASAGAAMQYWRSLVHLGLAEEEKLGPRRILRVRYEDLVSNAAGTLDEICRFLGVVFDPDTLQRRPERSALAGLERESADGLVRPLHDERVGRFRKDFDSGAVLALEKIGGDALARLGYARVA